MWFSHYAGVFNTVELNSTFYHFPKTKTAKGWCRKAPEGFVYSVKANKIITHLKRFENTQKLINDFYAVARELEEKLGCVLFQLPPSMRFDIKKLDNILSQLDPDVRNVIEFRHPSWWNEEVFCRLKSAGVIFCIVNAPRLPEDFIKTAKDIYIRFHGKTWYNYDYSKEDLESFADKINNLKLSNVWAYFNNDFDACAPKNALELRRAINEA